MAAFRIGENGSYICEYGHIHDYSKLDLKK